MSAARVPAPEPVVARLSNLRFEDAAAHLDAWFAWMDVAAREADAAVLERIAVRIDRAAGAALRRGVRLPFEELSRTECLDRTDRTVLLALLRCALEQRNEGGLSLAELLQAMGGSTLRARLLLQERLEESGSLRRLGYLQSDRNVNREDRLYRLSPEAVDQLGRGRSPSAEVDDPMTPDAALTLVLRAARLIHLVQGLREEGTSVWATAVPDGPGWDSLGLPRSELLRLLANLRSRNAEPLGNILADAKLDEPEGVMLALLAAGPDGRPEELPAPTLISAAIPPRTRGIDTEALLSSAGRLVRSGLVCLPNGPVPMPFRTVALTRTDWERLRLPVESTAPSRTRPVGFRIPNHGPHSSTASIKSAA